MMKNLQGVVTLCAHLTHIYRLGLAMWRVVHSNKNDKLSTKFEMPALVLLLSFSASATFCYILLWAVFNFFFFSSFSSVIKHTHISFCCFGLAAITSSRAPHNCVQFFSHSCLSIEKYSIWYFQQW